MYSQGYRPPQQPQQGNWYAPPPKQAGGQKNTAPKKRSGRKPPRKKRPSLKWQLVKVLLVLLALGAAAGATVVWKAESDVKPYQNVFLNNITVDGIDLSGKTWDEGNRLVWDQINQKQNGWYI